MTDEAGPEAGADGSTDPGEDTDQDGDADPESVGESGTGTGTGTGSGSGGEHEHGGGRPVYAPPDEDAFDWRGWFLVGLVFVCFLLIPWTILLLPGASGFLGSLGLSLRDAYLTLPLLPALLLGAVAVWSAVASRRE